MEEERFVVGTFGASLSELGLSSERAQILKEGFVSARENKDLFQARLILSIWSLNETCPPHVLQELTQSLEQEWEDRNINIKFDTQLEDETINDEQEILFRKVQRCTDQNERLKSGEDRIYAVVVPSYWKEEEGLPKTITSIAEQRFDGTVILVVSDNNDEEGKEKFNVGGFAKGKGANVATGSIPGNIASARRKGVDRALQSEMLSTAPMVLISTDSDTVLEKGHLRAMRKAYENGSVIATTGQVIPDSDDVVIGRMGERSNKYIKHLVDREMPLLLGSNFSIRADIFRKVGGYYLRIGYGEDGHLSQKFRDYLKYEGKDRGEKVSYVGNQLVRTSVRKFVDEDGKYSFIESAKREIKLALEFSRRISQVEGVSTILGDPRDPPHLILLGQTRKLSEQFSDLKYLFSGRGEERIRARVRRCQDVDNFYQRVNNLPEVRSAILKDTQQARDDINSTFKREFEERGVAGAEGNISVLVGAVLKEKDREVSVFMFRKPSEKGGGNRYLAVEVERDPSSDTPPLIASFTEIDEGAATHFTKVSWYPERMYFHPDDDYPRTAALIFNTHHASISKIPTEDVDVFISEEEVRRKGGLLKDAYENSKGDDNPAVEILHEYITF